MSSARQFVPRAEARKIFITSKSTINFRHLLPVAKPRHIVSPSRVERIPEPVLPKDRIKWWNIVPGDQVRVMAEKSAKIREVKGINKFANRVYIEGDIKRNDRDESDIRSLFQVRNPHKNVHYSGLQLYLGNHDFPPLPGSSEPRNLPVFALRMGTSEPKWVKGRWVWERYATATTPRLPDWRPGKQERLLIPWPEPDKPTVPKPTKYDTPQDVIAEVTYVPSKLSRHLSSATPALRTEKGYDYDRMLRKEIPYNQNFPMELFIARELSNPHSRAKKRERYLAAKARQQLLLKEYMADELKKTIEGRSKREAIAEATFKWRERIRLDRKAELKRRWIARGLKARLERRRRRAQEKLEFEKKKLRELVLRVAPNQVMPKP
ncbi:uncharacterized protein FOMMEDRAFT_19078 [Fomitiporia mediterranea MF3/22]|uniref:uncharacterized protein n=1 Tax=Fomitiporia mediterranea (strain MF3/22) TaxID=694068 RepID=UPI000440843F|nr:uncharacterized protein FOMMEDRAFT_19078 [Fomitiporia mediterranea MF3/22]EJD03689.1 hypothetical protein FOMMEDRAFT_19078 [Fomitiporia mediterranea MF3/22]